MNVNIKHILLIIEKNKTKTLINYFQSLNTSLVMGLYYSKYDQNLDTQLTDRDKLMLVKSTHFNEDEIDKIYKLFIHVCPNGQINQTKFIMFFKEFHLSSDDSIKENIFYKYLFK